MARYQKPAVEVEAMRVPLTNDGSVAADLTQWSALRAWLDARGAWRPLRGGRVELIKKPDGPVVVNPGDWIICERKGALHACSPGFFGATYEPADQTPAAS